MLPDISKRNKLFGFDRKRYDDAKLHELLEWRNHDGVTTKNAVRIVGDINEWLDESKNVIIQLSAVFLLLKDIESGKYDNENAIMRTYADNIDRQVLIYTSSNVMRAIKSLSAQRKLFRAVKPIVKVNRINKDWDALLTGEMKGLWDRIDYLKSVVIPENLIMTPVGAYVDILTNRGETLYDDVRKFVTEDGALFDDEKQSKAYKKHVLDVLSKIGEEDAKPYIDHAIELMAQYKRRIDRAKEAAKAQEQEELQKKVEDSREIILGLCSTAEKRCRKKRRKALEHRSGIYPEVYVIAGARMKPYAIGYLYKAGFCDKGRRRHKFAIGKDVDYATLYNTEEQALEALNEFKGQQENNLAEIAKVSCIF